MAPVDLREHVLEEWLRLPESRRRHATDAVAFAFRLLRERPDLAITTKDLDYEAIITWLMPHIRPASG
jgi:hypothetical protein